MPTKNMEDLDPRGLALPLSGVYGKDWVIPYYVDQRYYGDQDPSSSARDYKGGPRSYDRHEGTDFLVPNFRSMDNNLIKIRAAAAGEVIVAEDHFFDRVVADKVEDIITDVRYQNKWNRVLIRHANNYQTTYGHMKRGSAFVREGDRVAAGDPLGIIGSSGCSTIPHLHFEVRDDTGRVVDPFKSDLWHLPPAYETPLGLLDYCVLGPDTDFESVHKDPPDNLLKVSTGSCIRFAVYVAGIKAGQLLSLTVTGPDGQSGRISARMRPDYNDSFFTYSRCCSSPLPVVIPGEWILNAYADDTDLQVNHTLMVE